MVGHLFKGFVKEGEREVIFPGILVKHPVMDAHSPTSDCSLRYELISLILDHYHASLLRNHLNWPDPFTVLHEVDDTRVQ